MRLRLPHAELAVALGVVALGLFLVVETMAVPDVVGYSRIGPRAYPWAISLALTAVGVWLVRDAWIGRRNRGDDPPEAADFDRGAFAFISLGLVLHMLLIERAGFVVASVALFVCVARAFGDRRLALGVALGLALAVAVYVGFDRGLGLNLPAGILEGIL